MFLSKFRKWKADKEDHEVVKIVDYETGLEIFYSSPDEQDVEVEGGEQEKGERTEVQEDVPADYQKKHVLELNNLSLLPSTLKRNRQ